jgi:hypothetical protein
MHGLHAVLAAHGGELHDLISLPGESALRTMVVIEKSGSGQKFDKPG